MPPHRSPSGLRLQLRQTLEVLARYRRKYRQQLLISVLLFAALTLALYQPWTKAATSPWTQTDWSGGVGSSTVNQYASSSNVVTATAGQVTLAATASWYNTDWKYRKKITLDNRTSNLGVTSESLSNFPILVKLDSGSDIDYTKTKDAGEDIRFADSDGTTLLKYEIEKWDETGSSYIWVKVPQIDIDSNTDFLYLYYGNTAADDASDAANVWDANYRMVQHMNNNPAGSAPQMRDSKNSNHGTSNGSMTADDLITGKAGGAIDFDGNNDYLNISDHDTLDVTTMSMEFWFKPTTTINSSSGRKDPLLKFLSYWLIFNYPSADGKITFTLDSGSPSATAATTSWTSGSWYYVIGTHSGTEMKVYVNGLAEGTPTTTSNLPDVTANSLSVAASPSQGFYFPGVIDEVRISATSRTAGWIAATYKTMSDAYASYEAEEDRFVASGTLTSNIFNTEMPSNWGELTFTTDGVGTSEVRVRTSNSATMEGATAFASCSAVSSGTDLSTTDCATDAHRYVQYQISLAPAAANTPTFQEISIAFSPADITAPENPTTVVGLNQSGGSVVLTSGTWYNYPAPSFTWSGAVDTPGPEGNASGIQGYFVYFGSDSTANPQTAGAFQTDATYTAANPTTGTTYYLRIKTRDVAQNVSATTWAAFVYKYDATQPVNPAYVAANPAGYASTNSFSFIWPVGSDSLSAISGYYYKTGATSGAYATDQLTTATLLNNIPAYTPGQNVFYVRSADTAGNTNSSYVQVTYYYNPDAPSAPQTLTVTPASNTVNSFAFSWTAPATYKGQIEGYRYSVNAEPTATNTTFTAATSLSAAPYATQVGENTFYIVAEDDSGNINYDVFASVTFSATTAAPGAPTNLIITDASNRVAGRYALTISWDPPSPLPPDFDGYRIERAMTDAANVDATVFAEADFSEVAQVTDAAYTNTNLAPNTTYAYRVKTTDSTANASVASSIVNKIPTGKYPEAPAITKGPTVETRSMSAVVVWTTDRAGTSFVQYGTSPSYGSSSGSLDAATDHSVTITGLLPSATYHLRAQTIDVPELVDYSTTTEGFSPDVIFKTLEAPGITDIEITDITLSSAIVSWKTNVVSTSKIRYGTTLGYGLEVDDSSGSQTTNHAARITGLTHSTLYHIRIDSRDAEGGSLQSDDYVFETLKLPVATNIQFQPVKGKPTATVDVVWSTNVPTTSVVSYRPVGAPTSDAIEQSKATLETAHSVSITNLLDDTTYQISVGGRDGFGNAVVADTHRFKTDTDSRAPQITDIIIEVQTQGRGDDAKAQIIVTWNTDEPTTAQVEYGPGLSSADYPNRTTEEAAYSNTHVIVVSELDPAKTYHLRVRSRDRAGNASESGDHVVITGKASSSILDLILTNLERTFGWLGNWQ